MNRIRCKECGHTIAYEIEPINDKGQISIMCNNRKANGEKCRTINIIKEADYEHTSETD